MAASDGLTMARLLGLILFFGGTLSSMGWSLTNLPEPTTTLAYTDTPPVAHGGSSVAEGATSDTASDSTTVNDGTVDDGTVDDGTVDDGTAPAAGRPDLLAALAKAGFETRDEVLLPKGPGLVPGIYRVADAVATQIVSKAVIETPGRKPSAFPRVSRTRTRVDVDYTPRTPPYDERQVFVEGNIAPVVPALPRGEIDPGLYATGFDAAGCSYELSRVMQDRRVAVIGEEYLAAGRVLVDLNAVEPDWFTSSGACGGWYRWSPLDVPLSQASNGDYWVGDLASGVWQVPVGCRWEKVVSFRGGQLDDVQAFGNGPDPLVIDDETYGLRIRGCPAPLTFDVQATAQRATEAAVSDAADQDTAKREKVAEPKKAGKQKKAKR
jgi:hypothetical protein